MVVLERQHRRGHMLPARWGVPFSSNVTEPAGTALASQWLRVLETRESFGLRAAYPLAPSRGEMRA